MDNDITIKDNTDIDVIKNRIYEVRGLRVMLDRDLAELYNVETRTLNQAVKRNIDRFPDDFLFRLNKNEWTLLKSQIVISNSDAIPADNKDVSTNDSGLKSQIVISNRGGDRALPYAFTELGIAMLSSETAIQVNIYEGIRGHSSRNRCLARCQPESGATVAQS